MPCRSVCLCTCTICIYLGRGLLEDILPLDDVSHDAALKVLVLLWGELDGLQLGPTAFAHTSEQRDATHTQRIRHTLLYQRLTVAARGLYEVVKDTVYDDGIYNLLREIAYKSKSNCKCKIEKI